MIKLLHNARVVLPLTVAALAACSGSDSTSPRPATFNPTTASADAAALASILDAPVLVNFQAATFYIDAGPAPVAAAVSGARQLIASKTLVVGGKKGVMARGVARDVLRAGRVSAATSLPFEALGTTFVYDSLQDQYVASALTGAPANGVRFILYQADLTGRPDATAEIGYIDLIDLAPAGDNTGGIQLIVVADGTTYLDYTVNGSQTTSSADLTISGYLTNGTTRADFDTHLSETTTASDTTENLDFTYEIPSRNFTVEGSLTGLTSTDDGVFTMTVTSGGTPVRYDFASTATVNTATVYVNGQLFATITQQGEADAVVQGAGGRTLTNAEINALQDLLGVAVYSFLYFFLLLLPVAGILGGVA